MRTKTVLDVFGALILLAAIGLVVRNPRIVSTTFGGFNTALGTAVRG